MTRLAWWLLAWLAWLTLALPLAASAQTPSQSLAPQALAPWQAPPANAVDVAAGPRGEAGFIDTQGALWQRNTSTGAWATVGRGMARLAIDNDGGLWALDTQGRINRLEGAQWRLVVPSGAGAATGATNSSVAADIAATPDGGVIVALLDGQLTRYDRNRRTWSNTPGAASRVAVDNQGVTWIIGADGAVLRSLGGAEAAWVSVTARASDIAADGSGRVVITGLDNRLYEWQEATVRWQPLASASSAQAVALGAGRLWRVELDGRLLAEGTPEPGVAGNLPLPQPPRAAVATRWVKLSAPAVQVVVSTQADVYALDSGGNVWRLAAADVRAERMGNWTRQPGNFTRLRATLDGRLWGIDRESRLWALAGSVWRPAAEGVLDVAAAPDGALSGAAWLLRSNGQLVALANGAPLNPAPPAAAGAAQSIHSDEHGQPWTTHANGRVERYDGTRWLTAAQPPQAVASLAIGAEGTVFAVSPQGALGRRDATSGNWFAHPTPATTPPATPIGSVAVGPDGLPWIVTTRGELFAERPLASTGAEPPPPSVFTRLLSWRAVGGGPVARVSVAADGGVLALGADGAVWRWRGGSNWGTVPGRLAALAAAPNGAAWGLDSNGRALQLRGGFWVELPAATGAARLLTTGPNGTLWTVQGDDQIVRWDEPGRRWVLVARALPQATALAVGPDGETWLIGAQGGVHRLQGSQWGQVGSIVASSLSVGPDGTVYATAADQAIHWLDRRDMAWKPAEGRALHIAVGPAGAPWAVFADNRVMASGRFLDEQAVRDGANKPPTSPPTAPPAPPVVVTPSVPPSTLAPLSYQLLASDMRVQDIGIGAEGSVFAIGADGSLQCFSNPDSRFTVASMGRFQRVAVTTDGSPWVLAANGVVSRFDKGAWRVVPEFNGRDIASGPDGVVWAAGTDGASYRYVAAADRFERQLVQRSDSPIKARRIAGANGGVHWVAAESNTLFECRNGDCVTRLIGVADVAVAPDNTVFVVDLLGNLQRYNATRRAFERQNGSGVSLSVGPQGLPWLVAADGRVSHAGLFAAGSRTVNTAQCAARFANVPAPPPVAVGANLTAADDALVLPAGLAASVALLLDNDRLNGVRPLSRDVSVSIESPDGLLRVDGEVLQVDRAAPLGAVLSGTYRICSRAVAGVCAAARVSVSVAAVPGAATSVVAVAGATGSGQALVSFTPPAFNGGSAITRYTVTSSPDGAAASGVGSPLTVSGLRAGVAYTFVVTATNAVGTGPASVVSNSVTPAPAIVAPGAPTGVLAQAGNAQALVSFEAPPANGGSPITGYTVTALPGGISVSGTASPILVSGLTNGTAYRFTVVARNAVGNGPASAPSAPVTPVTVATAPSNVVATSGNGQASVSFTPPADSGGSAITGYRVTASPGGQTAQGSASPIVVTGLTNGQAYSFTVAAINASGLGPNSPASLPVTPGTVPGAPTAVVASLVSPSEVHLVFVAPASNGGLPITGYSVTAEPAGPTQVDPTGLAQPLRVQGLAPGVNYRFTVTARNALGAGVASAPSNVVNTQSALPGAPTAVVATRGNAQASVAFTPPANVGGGPITGYTVTASPGGATATGAASPLVVSGLANGTAYQFTVRATNAFGSSAPSVASAPVTPATVPAAPSAVTEELFNTNAVWIGFTPSASDGGSPITGYRVVANPPDPALSIVRGADFRGNPVHVVSGLANNRDYTFSVIATNALGDSTPSAPSRVVNPSTRPLFPGAISGVPGNGQITVNLLTPASDGGSPITSYTVEIWPLSPVPEPRRFVSGPTNAVVVTGLTNGVQYAFHGWANNANGRGATSPANGATPGLSPGAPTGVGAVRGNAQATVSFTAPAGALANPITGYTVTASPGGATATGTASPIVVTGLANGTAYTFTVRAINAVGSGTPSVASAPVTPATVPNAPTAVIEELTTTSEVTVSFTPPGFNGGSAITGYRVVPSPADPALVIFASGPTSYRVQGLTFNRAYTFSVVASNALGESVPSAASRVVNPSTRPLFPGAISGTAGNRQITVNLLTPSSDGGSPILSYTAVVFPLVPNGEPTRIFTGPTNAVVATGLTNGVAYCYHGWASNANGRGATSPACPAGGTTPGP